MSELINCPLCESLVFSNKNIFHCKNCRTIYTKMRSGGIKVNRVGKIKSKDLRRILSMMIQNMKFTETGTFHSIKK
jgi:hypothetical protein